MASLLLTLSVSASIADSKTPTAPAPSKTPDAARMVTDDCARATKLGRKCEITIEAEVVGGEVATGNGTSVGLISFGQHVSLIRARRDFITEIIKTAEDL